MARLRPYVPKSHGRQRIDDRRMIGQRLLLERMDIGQNLRTIALLLAPGWQDADCGEPQLRPICCIEYSGTDAVIPH